MECKFCKIANGEIQDYKIWENNNFIALLDINPAKPGHCMLIPKKHVEDIFDLEKPLFTELFNTAKKLSKPLKSATNAKRVGMVIVGFEVPHAHLHLVPLHKSNELFDPSMFSKANSEELNSIANKIKREIEKYNKI